MVLDSNFLANPGFVIKNEGNGQIITMELAPRTTTNGTTVTQNGWADIIFMDSVNLQTPYAVSPAVEDEIYGAGNNPYGGKKAGIARLLNFVTHNPIHIKKINLRASDGNTLPSQIVILTPNPFTGVMDRQIVDVSSRKNAYQFQNDIITLDELDLFVGRDAIIRFTSAFTRVNWQEGDPGTLDEYTLRSSAPLYVDITVDYYISLEKGLVNNVQLMKTTSGTIINAAQEIQKTQAISNPETITIPADMAVSETGLQNAKIAQTFAFPMRGTRVVQTKTISR